MAIDQIWKQQLALISYGNEYLAQRLSIKQWVGHQIFNQHQFEFRDLLTQHLLAQHFQIWLEGLAQQGVQRISLHHSSLLGSEKNPNANIELLEKAHFIVSHHPKQKKMAWIFGRELAEWDRHDDAYLPPQQQRSDMRSESLWRFELNSKLSQRIEQDLIAPNWDEIQQFTDFELFESRYAQDFIDLPELDLAYYGEDIDSTKNKLTHATDPQHSDLALIPERYPAAYAHQTLYRLHALNDFINAKISTPVSETSPPLSTEARLNLYHFSDKLDDLTAKFIVKVANHYQTAQVTPKTPPSPFEPQTLEVTKKGFKTKVPKSEHKVGKSSVLTLIVITLLICVCAYYFGL